MAVSHKMLTTAARIQPATNQPASKQPASQQSYVNYFQQRILRMATHWRDHQAVQRIEVAYLDRERGSILKAITLGLDFAPAWQITKALMIALAPYMERRGHWATWQTMLERAIAVAQRQADQEAETTFTALLARLFQRMSRPQDVIRHYRRTILLARQTGNRYEEARACSNLGYLYIDHNRWLRSEVLSKHALAIFTELGSEHGQAHTRNHLGILYTRTQRWQAAESNLEEACQLWIAMDDQHSLIYGYENLAVLYNDRRMPKMALVLLQNAETLIQETGETAEIATIWTNMAYDYRLLGEVELTVHYSEKAEALFRQQTNVLPVARIWHNLALLYLATGDEARATHYYQEAHTIYGHFDDERGKQRLRAEYQAAEYQAEKRPMNWPSNNEKPL